MIQNTNVIDLYERATCLATGPTLNDVVIYQPDDVGNACWVAGTDRQTALGHFERWLNEEGRTLEEECQCTREGFTSEAFDQIREAHARNLAVDNADRVKAMIERLLAKVRESGGDETEALHRMIKKMKAMLAERGLPVPDVAD